MGRRAVDSATPAHFTDDNNNDVEPIAQVSTAQVSPRFAGGSEERRRMLGDFACQNFPVRPGPGVGSGQAERASSSSRPSSLRARGKRGCADRLTGVTACAKILAASLAFVCFIAPLANGIVIKKRNLIIMGINYTNHNHIKDEKLTENKKRNSF